MTTAQESRRALSVVADESVGTALYLLSETSGDPVQRRRDLLTGVPDVIGYYSDGSAALAVDFYTERRDLAREVSRFTATAVIADRTVAIRRAVAWAADPLFMDDDLTARNRLAEVVQLETSRPYRDTITGNRRRDPAAVGWQRITNGGCRFCRMLAERGAIYKEATALFASHPNCHCTAQPVFGKDDTGEEASTIQYLASKRSRTPAQRAKVRDYLDSVYGPDSH